MSAQTFQTVVDQITTLSYNVRNFRLRLAQPNRMAFEAGQFVIVHVPKDGATVKRAYSIASPPHEEGVVELCLQHVEKGIATSYFWQLKEGATVTLSGPHGNFKLKQPLTYEPVFLATGTGVAPFRGMIKHLFHVGATQPIWLFFGCRYEHTLLYEAEFRSLASLRHNFRYIPTVSRPKEWQGESGHIQQTFLKHIKAFANREMYICGWQDVVKSVNTDLIAAGVPAAQIHFEEWA